MCLLFFVVWSCCILFCCLLLLLLLSLLLLLLVLWWWWWRWCDDRDDRDCNSYTVDSWQRLSLVTILMMNILAMVVAMMILMIINIITTITIIKIMIIIAVMILIVAMTINMINTSITQCEHLMMHMFQHISSIYLYVHHVCLTTDWPLQMKKQHCQFEASRMFQMPHQISCVCFYLLPRPLAFHRQHHYAFIIFTPK